MTFNVEFSENTEEILGSFENIDETFSSEFENMNIVELPPDEIRINESTLRNILSDVFGNGG